MKVFVTGATGLIGSHVAERLRGRGDGVVAMVRPSSDTRHLQSLGCELATGDVLDDPEATARLMRGCDAVVHAAAKVFQPGSRKEYLRQNVQGTERVLRAASLAAPRVVHLSSVAVYAGVDPDRPLTEERWAQSEPDRQAPYAASKTLSERAAWALHDEGAVRLTTVRPCVVYGERDRSATRVIVRFVRLPVVPLPGGGRFTLPLVYAGNVARGILATLDRPATVGRAYNLALDHPITARELAERVAEGLGRKARVVSVSPRMVRGAARAAEAVRRLNPLGGGGDARRAARLMTRDNPYDSTRARLELGWAQLIPHEEALRRTMEWWRSRETE